MSEESTVSRGGGEDGESQGEGPLRWLHSRLRGRYVWAILLAVVLGTVAGVAGFRSGEVQYMSRGQIRVAPVLPVVLRGTDEKGLLPMYDAFVETQMSFIRSQRVLEMAMDGKVWQQTGRPKTDEALQDLGKNLRVTRGAEIIWVDVVDRDPQAAVAGVKSIIGAYRELYLENDQDSGERRMSVLTRQLKVKEAELGEVRQAMHAITEKYATEDLELLFSTKQGDLNGTQKDLWETQLSLGAEQSTDGTTRPSTANLSVEEIGSVDGRMSQYLQERENELTNIERLERRLGPSHPAVEQARQDLEGLNQKIEKYAVVYRSRPQVVKADGATREKLRIREQGLMARIGTLEADLKALGRSKLELAALNEKALGLKGMVEEFKSRIENLNIESALAGRISVLSDGDRPLAPYRDTHKTRAMAGALGGAALGFGLVLLFGLIDSRMRHPDDVVQGNGQTVLGILPLIPDHAGDPDMVAQTGDAVHRIRTMLQITNPDRAKQTFAITSPVAGTGKTSLTLALGMSFATAGSQTLLIDCDLVGGGLSARANLVARRKIGNLLERRGLIRRDQLDAALCSSENSGRRLGERLIQLGHLSEPDLCAVLEEQRTETLGLLDVLEGEPLDECIVETEIPGLFVLPLGNAEARHVGKVSPASLRKIIECARLTFDTVLIDTGPILGSLEAAAVAAVANGVVLTVSRGEQRVLTQQCITYLSAIGATLAGIVFNRAEQRHLLKGSKSIFTSGSRSRTSRLNQMGLANGSKG